MQNLYIPITSSCIWALCLFNTKKFTCLCRTLTSDTNALRYSHIRQLNTPVTIHVLVTYTFLKLFYSFFFIIISLQPIQVSSTKQHLHLKKKSCASQSWCKKDVPQVLELEAIRYELSHLHFMSLDIIYYPNPMDLNFSKLNSVCTFSMRHCTMSSTCICIRHIGWLSSLR